ncbi:hypothetical protein [Salinisphaera orenii]|uniref:hypothetical protein n=1 Tax=Salinisphaera orenii TaxID=856731 RepID=UPI0019550B80
MSGRGKSQKTIALIGAMYDILDEIQPATVRAVCYRLFVDGWIKNMGKNETGKVSRHLVTAREEGTIPWDWVVDDHRQVDQVPSWNDPQGLINAAVNSYRKDVWAEQPYHVEVWSEKSTVRGTLSNTLHEYGVPFRALHGYSSATVLHDVAAEAQRRSKPLIVLYVGDWDPSGMGMSEIDIPNRLRQYGATNFKIERVALTEDELHDLPHFEAATKKNDARHKWFVENYGERCWELDAMPPSDLRVTVEIAIDDYLDHESWYRMKRVEAAEVEAIENLASGWQQSISRQVSKNSHP